MLEIIGLISILMLMCVYSILGMVILTEKDVPPPIIGLTFGKLALSLLFSLIAFIFWPLWIYMWKKYGES